VTPGGAGRYEIDQERRAATSHVFVDAETLDAEGVVLLDSETAHHLTRVLRLRSGEHVTLSDGLGRWRQTTVTNEANGAGGTGPADFRLETTSEVVTTARPYPAFTLASAIPKGDRVEWLVQKAVELGVDTLQLLHTDRSAVRWKTDRAAKQMVRLRRIAYEAARQSRRVWLPELAAPVDASGVLSAAVVAEPGGRVVGSSDSFIAIGPEGGWSSNELESTSEQVSLSLNVLRTETAGLAAITLYVAHYH
jgi:16S rRNA (uracil1498-N3)-methyltransferase